MNATFHYHLSFCVTYHPHPHEYYRGLCPHHHGFTTDFIPIPVVLPQPSSLLPQFYRGYRCPHPHAALYSKLRNIVSNSGDQNQK